MMLGKEVLPLQLVVGCTRKAGFADRLTLRRGPSSPLQLGAQPESNGLCLQANQKLSASPRMPLFGTVGQWLCALQPDSGYLRCTVLFLTTVIHP
jgi:hypothetical protein